MDYTQAIQFLYSLAQRPANPLTLKRTKQLLERVNNPQRGLETFHVGGTSGKGSVVTLIAEILQAAGYRVGVNVSPYVQVPIERLSVNGQYIAPQELTTLIAQIQPLVQQILDEGRYGRLRYLELWMALALLYFQQQQVDLAVIEVGVGGRYDYTNVVEPLVSTIVTVDYDHMALLGQTLPEIAYQKAGIIKHGTPVVTAEHKAEALQVIQEECQAQGSTLLRLGQDFEFTIREINQGGTVFDYRGKHTYTDLQLGLLGTHQVSNAAIALASIEASGMPVQEPDIRTGLANAFIPGRLEIIQRTPRVLLDSAHNTQKIGALLQSLQQLFVWDRLIWVTGMLQTKDCNPMVRALVTLGDLLIATEPDVVGKPALDADALAVKAKREGIEAVVQPNPLDAIQYALSIAGENDLICVTGSLYLAGQIRGFWVSPEYILATRTSRPHSTSRPSPEPPSQAVVSSNHQLGITMS